MLHTKNHSNSVLFFEWLGGLIDGDGCFLLSKKGYGSLEITMDIRDARCLYIIKNKCGGSVKLRSNSNSIRYRLHAKLDLVALLNNLSCKLYNPIRLVQYKKVCFRYGLNLVGKPLVLNNGWLGGFFDADGCITINKVTMQLSLSIGQKNRYILEIIQFAYGGYIYFDKASNCFKWYITSKNDILFIIDYFKSAYVFSLKKNRLHLVTKFYRLKELKKQQNPACDKMFSHFFKKWDSFCV